MLAANQVSALETQQALWQAALYLAGVLIALGLVALVWAAWRKRFQRQDMEKAGDLTLADIRRLRDGGLLTQPEFERLRAVLLAAANATPGPGAKVPMYRKEAIEG